MRRILIKFLILFFVGSSVYAEETYILNLHVKGLQSRKGHIAIAIYSENDKAAFPRNGEKALKHSYVLNESQNGEQEISIDGLPPGEYALALFHDEDSDLKVRTGLFGMPKEGVAFSNNPRLIFGPPSFRKAKIVIGQGSPSQKLEIEMKYF